MGNHHATFEAYAFCGRHGFFNAPTTQLFATAQDAREFAAVWYPEVWAKYGIVRVTVGLSAVTNGEGT